MNNWFFTFSLLFFCEFLLTLYLFLCLFFSFTEFYKLRAVSQVRYLRSHGLILSLCSFFLFYSMRAGGEAGGPSGREAER